jgi:hypothetical protein
VVPPCVLCRNYTINKFIVMATLSHHARLEKPIIQNFKMILILCMLVLRVIA